MDSFMNWINLKKNQVNAGGLEPHRLLITVIPLLLFGQMGSCGPRCMPDCSEGPLDWEWAQPAVFFQLQNSGQQVSISTWVIQSPSNKRA